MLANSDHKQDLLKHCIGTMMLAIHCAKHLGISDEDLINVIGLSAFLHDVGKCTTYFNSITLTDDYSEATKQKHYPNHSNKQYPRHNEISWVYALFHAKTKGKGIKFKDIGPQAIYWHHATLLKPYEILDQANPRTSQTIIDELNSFNPTEWDRISATISQMISDTNFPFDINKYIEEDIDPGPHNISRLFVSDNNISSLTNSYRLIVRSCLIFADHIISKLSVAELDDLIVNGTEAYFPSERNIRYSDFQCPEMYDPERFQIQKEIANSCGHTTLVKGSAGFGKSLIGLMWGAKKSGPVYWVCPRNAVAEGVYYNLLNEVSTLGLKGISIELYFAGERQATNAPHTSDCSCDIVVTNIDNLLSPMVDSKATGRLFDVTARNVVLDEYHEFLNDEALFGAFVVYMRARNLVCHNSNTLLLSATPSILHNLWDGSSSMTKVLPNETEHYKAQHKKLYKISFEEEFVEDPIPGSLTMYSSVRNVQFNYKNGYTDIVHSYYGPKDRHAKMSSVLAKFGKNGSKDGIVISAPILQAALDISFTGLYKTIESPESDIQTVGRINRWGEQDGICNLVMLNLKSNRGENAAITERYNCTLSNIWARWLESHLTAPVDLDTLYVLYNEFNSVYSAKLIEFVTKKYQSSIMKLQTFFPRARRIGDNKKVIAAKTLRNSSNSVFIVVKNRAAGTWCPFTFNIQEVKLNELLEDRRNLDRFTGSSTLKTVWENLEVAGDYDYSELTKLFFGKTPKAITVKKLLKFARCEETPLPIFSWYYDTDLGLIQAKKDKS